MAHILDDVTALIHPWLVRHAQRELARHGLNASDAEDVAQEAWIQLLTGEVVNPEAWLRYCVCSLVIDRARRRSGTRRGDPLDMEPVPIPVDLVG